MVPVSRHVAHFLCVALVTASMPACVRRLPASPIPAPMIPAVAQTAPPAPGMGRLVVDVVQGPTPVQVAGLSTSPIQRGSVTTYRLGLARQPLCSPSPCAADLPLGNHVIQFPVIGNDDWDEELVHIGPDPSVYLRDLSLYQPASGAGYALGIVLESVGAASAITGVALLPVGLSKGNDGLTTAGAITLGAGALMIGVGYLLWRKDAPTYRPGSSNHFPLAATP
jgi:hypothetical protein